VENADIVEYFGVEYERGVKTSCVCDYIIGRGLASGSSFLP